MDNFEIYDDIAKRTGGDIYVGVVGPVRTGKSTFISKFMNSSILDNIKNEHERKRAVDEMPQSGAGKTIMTMQPKFVPSEAVCVDFGNNVSANVRLVDCVGYIVPGAAGFEDETGPRMVKTPWSDEEMTFERAAEIGTHKVIADHSTIAVLVTTDGTIADLPRESYISAEERVVCELKQNSKPFVIILNSRDPQGENAQTMANELKAKYNAPVLPLNIAEIGSKEILDVIKTILMEFPITKINFKLPKWARALPYTDELIGYIFDKLREKCNSVCKMSDYFKIMDAFDDSDELKPLETIKLNMSNGEIDFNIPVQDNLYYKILSKECGEEITDDFYLIHFIKDLVKSKQEYDKIKTALDSVKETGYGIVNPTIDDLLLAEPEVVTKGGNTSIKLKATAPSLHIMRVDVGAEISPAVGNIEQGGSLVKLLLDEVENNKQEIWNKNIFGKPMSELIRENIDTKLAGLPEEVQTKMRKTLTKIVNERKGGIICILL